MDPLLLLPATWGFAGGLLFGALEVVTAYSTRSAEHIVRRRAWLRLGLGVVAGPILSEAMVPSLVKLAPALDLRTISFLTGWLAAKDPRGLIDDLKTTLITLLGKGQRHEPT